MPQLGPTSLADSTRSCLLEQFSLSDKSGGKCSHKVVNSFLFNLRAKSLTSDTSQVKLLSQGILPYVNKTVIILIKRIDFSLWTNKLLQMNYYIWQVCNASNNCFVLDKMCWHCDDTGWKRDLRKTTENVEEFCEAVTIVTVFCTANVTFPQRWTKTMDSYFQMVSFLFWELDPSYLSS